VHIVIAVSVWYSSNYDAVEEKNKQYAARLDCISFVAALLNVLYLADSAVINKLYSSKKNFDSSINKEKKYKKRHTQSTYRNRHTNNTSYSMVNVQQWACILP